jgi:hypothetical protein
MSAPTAGAHYARRIGWLELRRQQMERRRAHFNQTAGMGIQCALVM